MGPKYDVADVCSSTRFLSDGGLPFLPFIQRDL